MLLNENADIPDGIYMGSGKTHWGKQLAAELKIPFYSTG